jgi:hypothetical protein
MDKVAVRNFLPCWRIISPEPYYLMEVVSMRFWGTQTKSATHTICVTCCQHIGYCKEEAAQNDALSRDEEANNSEEIDDSRMELAGRRVVTLSLSTDNGVDIGACCCLLLGRSGEHLFFAGGFTVLV